MSIVNIILNDEAQERRRAFLQVGRLAGKWVLYVVPSIVLPILLGVVIRDKDGSPVLDNFDQTVIGALLFVAITLSGMAQDISTLARAASQETRVGRIESQLDGLVANLKVSFTTLLQRNPYGDNLFAQLFTDSLSDLERAVNRAAVEQSLPVDKYTYRASEFTTNIIAARNRDVLRFVHHAGDNFLDTIQGQDYYRRISTLGCNGNVVIRRLVVYRSIDQLQDELTQRIIAFHARNRNHDCRLISEDSWSTVLTDLDIHEHGDMGVWGDVLAYHSPKLEAANNAGTYSTDPIVIVRLAKAFSRAWDFADAPKDSNDGPMTIYELATGRLPPSAISRREYEVVGSPERPAIPQQD
ncbi:hypothetical protein [Promicromonospora sp. NPDC023805]|uniref:hypothetical protein n=1 Tax=Promicromonospora sp. NPDC023805 TaxID=3154696 RepID=UPI0033CCF457